MSWFDPWDDDRGRRAERRARSSARSAAPRPAVRAHPRRARSRGRELDGRPRARRCSASTGDDLLALVRTADAVRAADVGDDVTYVVNRNINFTNVCFVNCQFCAFKRQRWEADAYTHGLDVVLGKVDEAIARGATEVCMQGGINPDMPPFTYRDVLVAIKTALPRASTCTPSRRWRSCTARAAPSMDYPDYIGMLRDGGLGSIPGTAAEILDDEVREILSHKKVDVRTWIEIITTAHRLGVPTTSTVMYGHVETPGHVARHIDLLRDASRRRPAASPSSSRSASSGRTRSSTTTAWSRRSRRACATSASTPTSRLMLRGVIDNLQTSWVKLGHRLAQLSLRAGCNDFGGTLMEESISREAGADAGEYTSVEEIEALVRGDGPRAGAAHDALRAGRGGRCGAR